MRNCMLVVLMVVVATVLPAQEPMEPLPGNVDVLCDRMVYALHGLALDRDENLVLAADAYFAGAVAVARSNDRVTSALQAQTISAGQLSWVVAELRETPRRINSCGGAEAAVEDLLRAVSVGSWSDIGADDDLLGGEPSDDLRNLLLQLLSDYTDAVIASLQAAAPSPEFDLDTGIGGD